MVNIKVKLYEVQGTTAKQDVDIDIEWEKPTVFLLLQKLSQLFGKRILDYMITVNGREIRKPEDFESKLSEKDMVAVFMPVSGG